MAEAGKGRRSDSLLRFSLGALSVLAGAYAWSRVREDRMLAEAEGLTDEAQPQSTDGAQHRARHDVAHRRAKKRK